MKHLLWTGLCCAAAFLTTVGCSDDTGYSATETGSVSLSLEVDRRVLTAQQSRASLDELTQNLSAADFKIRLTGEDGQTQEWPYESFTGEHVRIGRYTIEAYYGKEGEEGFDKPYFIGSEQINVTTDNVTTVSLTASMANSAVRVAYTDAFKAYMSEYKASVRTAGSADGIDYPSNVTDDDLFVNPGDASLYVSFKTIQGKEATLKAADFKAEARHRYTVTVDVNGGEIGDAVLSVKFDDETVADTREFTLSDELFNAPAPVVTPAQSAISVIEGSAPADGGKINIVARGGIAAVTLVTESSYLLGQGWPAEIDLFKASAEQQQFLKQHGLSVLGLWNNPDQMAVIDFTNVIASLRSAADNLTRFRVEVEDNFGKVSDPSALMEINVTPVTFAITGQDLCMVGDEQATLLVDYNGGDPKKDIKFENYDKGSGMWDNMTVVSVAPVSRAAGTSFRVTVKVPGGVDDIKVRATAGSLPPVEYTIVRGVPEFALANVPADNFATNAFVAINCDSSEDSRRIAQVATYELSADGGNTFRSLTATPVDGGFRVAGLEPSTSYVVRVTAGSLVRTVSLQTEAALAVPNGDFETLVDAVNFTDMNQSGKWSISAGINYQTTTTMAIKEPAGWATVNAKTASSSASPLNSWFVVPSTVNTTLSWTSTVPKIKVFNTGGGTDTPPAFKGLTAHNGSNAMVLRNVGWDHHGTVPGVKVHTGGTEEYYNHQAATVANRSAGKLFLGSYAYDNGNETYNEGVDFTSRPSSLSGYYKYERDASDASETGTVTVKVLSGSTVIAEGKLALEPAGSYTLFNVPLTYIANPPKATSVRIMFASSNHASYNQAEETANIKTTDRMSRYECYTLGAALSVDNLTFNY